MTGEEILALAAEAAREMGPGWAAAPAPNPQGALLRHVDGRELHAWQDHCDQYAGRVRIQGCYPGGWRCRPGSAPVITVRASRGGSALAGDIRRRMLPAYALALAEARETHAAMERRRAARDAVAGAVLAAGPGARPSRVQPEGGMSVDLPGTFRHAEISYDGERVSLKLPWLPADAALRMLRDLDGLAESPGAVVRPEPACAAPRRPDRGFHGRLRRFRASVLCGVAALTLRDREPQISCHV